MKTSHKLALAFLILCIAATIWRVATHSSNESTEQATAQTVQTPPAPGSFPGQGSQLDWQEARKIAHASANALRAKDLDAAVTLGQQAISKYANDPDILNNTAYALIQRNRPGDCEAAEGYMRQAVTINGTSFLYWENYGLALIGQNKLADGKEAFTRALQCNPAPDQAEQLKQNIAKIDATMQAPQQ